MEMSRTIHLEGNDAPFDQYATLQSNDNEAGTVFGSLAFCSGE
jgi:hypothetical protein